MIAITTESITFAMENELDARSVFNLVNETLVSIQQNGSPESTYNEFERDGISDLILRDKSFEDLVVGVDCDNDIVYDNLEGSLFGAEIISYEEFLKRYTK